MMHSQIEQFVSYVVHRLLLDLSLYLRLFSMIVYVMVFCDVQHVIWFI